MEDDISDTISPFEQAYTEADALAEVLTGLGRTTEDRMPTSGTAGYQGFFATISSGGDSTDIESLNDDPMAWIGDMTVDVDFASGSMTGEATNIIRSNGRVMDGSLDFVGSNIDAASASFDGQFSGNVDDFSFEEIAVTGAFAGENAEAIAATGEASVNIGGVGLVEYEIGFFAEVTE